MKNDNLLRVRKAILRHFGDDISGDTTSAAQVVKDATFTGKTDPGGWAPRAHVVVHCESGIPSGIYDERLMEKWYAISRELGDIYAEHINGAVIAFYDA